MGGFWIVCLQMTSSQRGIWHPQCFTGFHRVHAKQSHCLLLVLSCKSAVSSSFIGLERSLLVRANGMSGSHISSIFDPWTVRNCSCFSWRGSSESWEIQHPHVSIPGASEFGILCSARYVYGRCLYSLRERAERHSGAVMDSTYVCVCVCVGRGKKPTNIEFSQSSMLPFLL